MATAVPLPIPMSQLSRAVTDWVESVRALTQPAGVRWCEGTEAEQAELTSKLIREGELIKLNPEHFPGCHLSRSSPSDVARVEHLTYHLHQLQGRRRSQQPLDGPEGGACQDARALLRLHARAHALRHPVLHGPDRLAALALRRRDHRQRLRRHQHDDHDAGGTRRPWSGSRVDGKFVRGLHSIGELDPNRRFIMHFPEELAIESFGSGYGGNALLGKKCHALRIASWQARSEGWLAEHMLIVGLESPQGETHYIACAFPSACGKTNLAMLIPPASLPGWKVYTVGDDIAWLHPGADGRLWAINPEAGYFGVVPGTNRETNRNAYEMIRRDTLFTNVALTADNQPWWEGLPTGIPVTDWQGRPYDPTKGPAAHPNSRFTVSAKRNPSYSPHAEDPRGVPISALVFGGRRREVAPLVYEARNWQHGVLVGASVASETTAAAVGQVGVVRRDPMAMQPFCGYNFADYWRHWLTGRLEARAAAEDLPRQLVPARYARQVPLAGLRREPARARLDARSLQRQGRRGGLGRSDCCRGRRS